MSRLFQKTELSSGGAFLTFEHEIEIVNQPVFHLLPGNNRVDQPMFQKELGGLKSGRKFRLGRILNHTRPGETDHRARLSHIQITHGGETRHYARVRWVG